MHKYKGKSKCPCGKRAHWRVKDNSHNYFACTLHKERIASFPDLNNMEEDYTEADRMTWLKY